MIGSFAPDAPPKAEGKENCGRAATESRPRRAAVYSICGLKVLLDEGHQLALTHGAVC